MKKMKNKEKIPFGNTELGIAIGLAFVILAILLPLVLLIISPVSK